MVLRKIEKLGLVVALLALGYGIVRILSFQHDIANIVWRIFEELQKGKTLTLHPVQPERETQEVA